MRQARGIKLSMDSRASVNFCKLFVLGKVLQRSKTSSTYWRERRREARGEEEEEEVKQGGGWGRELAQGGGEA